MITYVYFVRFRVLRDVPGVVGGESVEGSFILRRGKSISASKDLEDVETYVERYVDGDVKKVEILVLSDLTR